MILSAWLVAAVAGARAGDRTATTAGVADLATAAERSGYVRTGRYPEVLVLCQAFAQARPDAVRCFDFGESPEGRPMKALAVSTSGALTAEAARARGLPVVLMQGGIHPGEIDGKDAGFLALREVLQGSAAPGALDHLVWLFVPVFNVDGHERFGAWNRPNQRGPEAMGWRATAQNYNLNRDYMKADAPEMRAMLRLIGEWDPLLTVDLHATNGAQFEHDVSIQIEPGHAGDARLQAIGRDMRDGVLQDLSDQGSLPLPFYPSLATTDDPTSGFVDMVFPPRFSTGYFHHRNRFSILVETHSWKTYPVRVGITRNTIVSVLERMARQGGQWRQAALEADARAARLAGKPVDLNYAATGTARTIDFRGYAYTRTASEVSGATMIRYDETRPQLWRVPLRDDVRPSLTVAAPGAGYLVPAAYAGQVGALLQLHGIEFRVLPAAQDAIAVETFRATGVRPDAAPLEGRQRMNVTGQWQAQHQDMAAGALFVPIAQARARLAMALLEPQAPDSLLAWGMFNAVFERKEYMEAYVAEQVAREMLAADPALRRAFEQRLSEDADFAASPSARLDFFYQRHSAWDQRLNLYPIVRTDTVP